MSKINRGDRAMREVLAVASLSNNLPRGDNREVSCAGIGGGLFTDFFLQREDVFAGLSDCLRLTYEAPRR